MTSPIGGISLPVFPTPAIGAPTPVTDAAPVTAPTGAPAAPEGGFAAVLAASFDKIQGLQDTANGYAAQAVTGDLRDVHDYLIASNEAKLATEMVVTLKNKAVEAFTEIMRMPV